jgi:pimeloyl-ACP methyl ester carboxylesterase
MASLNHKSYGSGPALIVLHGLFGSLQNWATLGRQMGERFSVFLLDQRNHGRSPWDARWDYAAMAADLAEFMDQQGIPEAFLLGHSMGGKTVMQFAAEYPERVKALVVADIAPKAYRPHHDEILAALNSLQINKIHSRKEAEAHLLAYVSAPETVQFLLQGLHRSPEGRFSWLFNLEVITRHYDEVLKAPVFYHPLDLPALFLRGELSRYILLPEDEELIRTFFPAAQIETIAQASHWLHAEQPEEFLKKVLSFLS